MTVTDPAATTAPESTMNRVSVSWARITSGSAPRSVVRVAAENFANSSS